MDRRIRRAGHRLDNCQLTDAGRRKATPAAPTPEPQSEKPPTATAVAKKPPAPKPAVRSEAITLLATLQREARFVDFIQESLAGYTDAQIGAAARDVHRDCGVVLKRLFAFGRPWTKRRGRRWKSPAGFDPARWRLTGNVAGEPPFRGRLVHPGWEATICAVAHLVGQRRRRKDRGPGGSGIA